MEKNNFKALLRHTVVVPVVALAILAAVLLWETQSLYSSMQWVDHTDQVISADWQLLKMVLDMETGLRGYLSTGNSEFLQPYSKAKSSIDSEFDALNQLVSENPAQQARLATIRSRFDEWQLYANHMIELRRSEQGGNQATLQGKHLMDSVRTEDDAFIATEERLRAERVRKAHNTSRLAAIACVLPSMGIAGFLAIFTRRRMRLLGADFQNSLDVAEKRAEEQKRAEAELRKGKERLELAVEVADLGEWELDLKNHRASRSLRHDQIFGYKSLLPDWTYEIFLDHVLPQHRAEVAEKFKAAEISRIWDFETQIQRADGEVRWIWARGRCLLDESGQSTRMFGTVMDVTERKRAEETLREAEERLRLMIENVKDYALFMLDPEGRVVTWNTGAQLMKGYAADEILGEHFSCFYTPEDIGAGKPQQELAIAKEKGRYAEEGWRVRQDGSRFLAHVTITAVHDAAGQLRGFAKITRDISESKQAEEQLQKLNRTLEALSNSNHALLHASSESEFLQQVCCIIKEDCGHAMVWIGIAKDDEDKTVRPVAHAGFEEGYLETLRITWSEGERGRGPTGTAIRTGRQSMCRNMLTDPAFLPWREEAIKRGYASSLVVPLMDGDKSLGALTIYSRMPDAFSEGEVSLLTELAEDLSYGVSTLRLRAAHSLAEKALRSNEAKLQGIIGSAMDAVISVDEQQRIVVFNRAAEIVFQCAASEAIGSALDRFIPKRLREAHHEHIRRFGSAGVTARSMNSPGILTAVRGNGEEFPIEATISQVQADGEHIFTVILRDITARKQADERIAHLASFPELNTNPIFETDLDGKITYVNPAAQKQFLTLSTSGGEHPLLKDWPTVVASLKASGEHSTTREIESDGLVFVQTIHYSPEFGVARAYFADITARERAEEALRESEAQFRTLADAIPQLCWTANADGWIFWYNERWYEYTGTTPEQMEGWGWQSVHNPDTLPNVLERWKGSIATGIPFDMVLPLRGGDGVFRPFLTRVMPVKNTAGNVVRWFGTNTDVTELRNTQEALRTSEQRWATTLQSIGDAVISTDATGNVEFMNDVAQRLTGWSLPEVKGTDLSTVFNIVQEVTRIKPENPVAKVIRLGKVVGLANHTALIRRDGTEIPIEDSGAPIRNREGQIEGVVLVFHDVSEQRKVEKALRNSDRLATTGRLAATIAHEIHNPLDAVGNLLFLISQGGPENTIQEYVSMASQELVRVTQMTQQMLAFQREAAKPIPVKIGQILDNVIALYDRKIQSAGIILKQQIDFDGHILALPGELRQMFANLVGNAIEAVGPRHGTITLRAYASRDWRRELPGLRVVVADDGPGIPAEVRTSIFEPFFTTKGESGTGLGLWITSDILRKYDGTMRLRTSTESGRSGTCFSVFFPFETSPDQQESI